MTRASSYARASAGSSTPAAGTRQRFWRSLTSPRTAGRPYGRWCAARVRAAAVAEVLADLTAAQAEHARQLLDDGGLAAMRRPGIYRAVATSGEESYLVCTSGCACPRGRWSSRCYHQLAVRLVTAGLRPRRRS